MDASGPNGWGAKTLLVPKSQKLGSGPHLLYGGCAKAYLTFGYGFISVSVNKESVDRIFRPWHPLSVTPSSFSASRRYTAQQGVLVRAQHCGKADAVRSRRYTANYRNKHDVIHKTGSIATPPREDRATVAGENHATVREVRT